MRTHTFVSWISSQHGRGPFLLALCVILVLLLVHACIVPLHDFKIQIFDSQPVTLCSSEAAEHWRALMYDNSTTAMEPFFRHATLKRNSSYPFISGDTFRAMADHVFDETTDVNKWPERMLDIGLGDTVFLGTEVPLIKFFDNVTFNKVRHSFVLITHNSDASVPTHNFKWILDSEKILAWFGSNPDHVHKKLLPIPIGLANPRWPHGNINIFKKAFNLDRKPFSRRTTLLYVNFQVQTNPEPRSKALKWALSLPNVTHSRVTSLEIYLRELGNAKFVVSPPGNGLDCHRTWEAILMGAVPIVLRSRLDPLFTSVPIVIIDDWNHLTIEYLQSFDYNPVPNQILFAKYWRKRLLDAGKRH